MGFMAGFGPAFAESFNAGNERRAREKDDLFKLTYKEYLDRRTKYEDAKEEDKKNINKAKSFARDMAGNEDAWPKVYEWLANGYSDATIIDMIENGKFTVSTPSPSAPTGVSIASGPDDIDKEMIDIGLSTKAPERDQGPLGKILNKAFGREGAETNESIGKISQVTGQSSDEISQILTGGSYMPKVDSSSVAYIKKAETLDPSDMNSLDDALLAREMALSTGDKSDYALANRMVKIYKDQKAWEIQLKAEAEGVRPDGVMINTWKDGVYQGSTLAKQDETGSWIDLQESAIKGEPIYVDGNSRPMTPMESEARKEVKAELKDSLKETQTQKINYFNLLRSAGTIADIAVTAPETLTSFSASSITFARDWMQEAVNLSNVIMGKTVENPASLTPKDLIHLKKNETAFKKMFGEHPDDIATAYGLIQTQRAIFSYYLGKTLGQDGRALAETERRLFNEVTSGQITVDQYLQNMGNLLGNIEGDINTASKLIVNNSTALKGFRDQFGYIPMEYNLTTIQEDLSTLEDKELSRYSEVFGVYDGEFAPINPDPEENEKGEVVIDGYTIRRKQQ